jgi:hypothetical protein
LKPADRLIVPKSAFGLVQHHAIYLGQDHLGRDLIAENIVGNQVCITTAELFFSKNPSISRIERFQGDGIQRRAAVESALKLVGKPYDLINYNCEHFANEVQMNASLSPQLQVGLAVILIAAFVAAIWD